MPFDWEGPTRLTFDNCAMNSLVGHGLSPNLTLDILRRCPQLMSLNTDINNSLKRSLPDVPPQPPAVLPALEELVGCRCSSVLGPKSIHYLVQHLDMAQLRLAYDSLVDNLRMLPSLSQLAVLNGDCRAGPNEPHTVASVQRLLNFPTSGIGTPLLAEPLVKECRYLATEGAALVAFGQHRIGNLL
ncbi:hypothetical protein B0H17DRAFT_1135989 [Mycena rosella]|uniref:Uncharacterized protein n=1 Tax=Mycena rosella TaxID=1033263 RepID=A0AAD7DBU2_MYCRO|nr:hypothetical protein B0H17DRAFT_1135989 [Mycena rosella]